MDRLLVAFLNTGLEEPDPLSTALGTAQWWAAAGAPGIGGFAASKPRFDASLAGRLRDLRLLLRAGVQAPAAEVPVTFAGDGSDAILFTLLYALGRAREAGTWRRVRTCTGQACGRYFLDRTKNASRRWCSLRCMERARVPRRRTITR